MSNFLAIATVTETLRQLLNATVAIDVPGAVATAVRPSASGSSGGLPSVGVNIFLYQITPNSAWREFDVPTRRSDGSLLQRPKAVLTLHYILTFYGDDKQHEPQRVLGSVVRVMHAQPVVARQMIEDAISSVGYLATSDLADAIDLVRITPSSVSLEDLSKLWSVFFQTPYALSALYEASVVLVETTESPMISLPVRTRNLYVLPFSDIFIEKIHEQAGDDAPIISGSTVLIKGRQLQGEITLVLVDGLEIVPSNVSGTEVAFSMPTSIHAGVHALQISHRLLMGSPPAAHKGFTSRVSSFVLTPTITSVVSAGPDITVTCTPKVGKSQRVLVLLNEYQLVPADTARAFAFELPARGPMDPDETSTFTITTQNVDAGPYLVRVQVDGAESRLGVDVAGKFNSPTVTMT